MPIRAVYLIFFLSGISGLVYQVIWVRWFGRLFGNTVYSASLVIAVFMCGLGVGSYLAGIWIDRRYRGRPMFPLEAYSYAELAIALFGLLIALLLPSLEPFASHLTFYTEDARGWHEPSAWSMVIRFAIAVVVLAPITTLMGATLALLIRYLLATDVSLVGWRIGFLYGFNTAGAALGAFVSDFALIPRFGLFATQMLAVALNLVAALTALRLVKKAPKVPPIAESPSRPEPDVHDDSSATTIRFTGLAILLSGFFAMGIEILWFRHFSIIMGGYRAVFSLLLTIVLIGIWLGALAGGYCHRRLGRPTLLFMITQSLFVILSMLLIATVTIERQGATFDSEIYASSLGDQLRVTWQIIGPMLMVIGLPALLMGFAYPLANANIQRAERHVGRRAGLLYLANTIGAVLGSICAGFLLLPRLGIKGSMTVLAIFGGLSVVSLYFAGSGQALAERRRLRLGVGAGCIISVLAAILLWLGVSPERFQSFGIKRGEKVLAVSEGVYELIAVTELPNQGPRRLKTNGHNMSGSDILAQRYMRAFSHIPLLLVDRPSAVLVICHGIGTTLHAASLHPTVERLEVADLSRHVVEQAHFFSASNHDVLDDPRVEVFINDGRQHMWTRAEESYDLITLEPPPIAHAGVSALYSREFYELARSRLRAGGFMSQWLPAYQLPGEVVRSMIRAFLDVFPNAVLLSGERRQLILLGSRGPPFTIDPVAVKARLDDNPALAADLARVHLGSVTEIVGTFMASTATLEKATRDSHPVTDDYPIMEYAAPATNCWRTRFPKDLIDVASIDSWCPRCVVDGKFAPVVATLGDYARALDYYYRSKPFLEYESCRPSRVKVAPPLSPDSPVFRETTYLGKILARRR